MKTCENCEYEHTGEYGSGRFCSLKCARGFSTKAKRKEINEKVSKKLTTTELPFCKNCKTVRVKNNRRLFCSVTCSLKYRGGWTNHSKINWSEVNKKAYREGKNYVAGGTTKWYTYTSFDGKSIKVQGSYELRMCKILDHWKKEKRIIDWEYTNDRIEYIGIDGHSHNYLFDFKVFDYGKSIWYIEVKGFIKENDYLKWRAVREQNIPLKIFKENELLLLEKEIGLGA